MLAYEQFAMMTMGRNGDYSVWQLQYPQPLYDISRFSRLIMLSLEILKSLIGIISLSHKSNMASQSEIWLFKNLWNIRLATCRLTAPPIPSQGDLQYFVAKNTYSALIPKPCSWEDKTHKVIVVFVLSSTTARKVKWFFICGWLALR